MATDRPAIAPMAGNLTEQRGRIKSPSFEFNSDRRKYVTTAKPLSIPRRLVCEGFEAPKANADSVGGDKEKIEDFEAKLSATFTALGFSSSEFRFRLVFPLASWIIEARGLTRTKLN